MDPAGELAQLGAGGVKPDRDLGKRWARTGDQLGHPPKALLGAPAKPPLQPAPLGVGGLDDPASGGRHLGDP